MDAVTRSPRRPRWLLICGAVLVLAAAAAVAAPLLVPVDRYRPVLEQVIRTGTGRDVKIGVLRLWLWPKVHVRAANIRLRNPKGFPPGDAIDVKSVDLGIEPRALLSRRLEITSVAINGVRVNVLSDAAGRTNFDVPAPPRGASSAGPAAPGRGQAPTAGQPLLTVAPIGTVAVKNVDLTFGALDAGRGQTAPLAALTGLSATVRSIDPNASNWAKRLEIAADLRGARFVTPALTKPVRIQSGRFLLKDGRGQGTFAAALDTIRATGRATIASLDPPSIVFAVSIPELDADRLQRLINPHGGPAAQTAAGPRRLIARGEAGIDKFTFAPLEARSVRGQLSVYTDAVRVDSYALSAYGGTVHGAAALNYAAAGLPTAATAQVRGVNLGAVVRAFSPSPPKITGALDADLRLATALGQDPEAALTGAGTFAVRNGSFPGLDLKSALAQTARALQLNVPAGQTRFSYFGGDLRIARERVYSTALRLEGEGLEGTGRGSLGFDKTLDYTGTGVLKSLASSGTSPAMGGTFSAGQMLSGLVPGMAGATGARVPFSIRGTFDDPKFALAGTPEVMRGPAAQPRPGQQQPQPQQPLVPQLPGLQDLLKPPP